MTITRRELLIGTTAAVAGCAGQQHPIAPDRRDDSNYWGKLSKQIHVTAQEVDEHRLRLDDQWEWHQDVAVFTRVRTI